ncbi:ABC-2 type transport system ATP-binding protein [Anaerosolibacter carboniphilus]|uniref:ABC-2 type transport system ATP-binding protein n=1 Tax=Anaerosolibacter carboniphilus TaxID=1417629 RepID=A0A841KX95_9FIRM|nr:ABC transporter ATP-binding protein [Anaerosolibacter carboniphilus]MBB6216878.1 ABC-2 type transport system ATP-binding protein [Anaerosolibacter carboniphilus]
MENILEIQNLSKSYKQFQLKDIFFHLKKGFIMGFIGPNGAGKTTTIKLIMNLLKKDAGAINVFGLDHISHEQAIKNRIGFVYDENFFYEDLTLQEMKKIISPFYANWDEEIFQHYIHVFQLSLKHKIKTLSKGMRMKYSLALALSHHAELIVMDEPTSGLDPVFRSELLDILAELMQDENKAILFSTHITTDLDKIADYITFIHDGEIIFSEEKDTIFEEYCIVKGGKDLLDQDIRKCFIGIRENQFGFEALGKNRDKIRSLFKDHAMIERPSLEDIMLYTVRGHHHV